MVINELITPNDIPAKNCVPTIITMLSLKYVSKNCFINLALDNDNTVLPELSDITKNK